MEAQVDTLRLLAQPKEEHFKNKKQPEQTENQTVWKSNHQGDKEETFIQTGRRGGDGQPGRRRLLGWWTRRGGRLWNKRMGQAVWQLADPAAPYSRIDKLGRMAGERSRTRNPGLQRWEIKPQTSD